jgi:hypothetical protein
MISLSSAVGAQEKRIGSGVGVAKCSELTSQYSEEKTATMLTFISWAQGFMSANNLTSAKNDNTYRSLEGEAEQQFKFLLTFCGENPDEYYTTAVLALYQAMPIKKLKEPTSTAPVSPR